MYRKPCKCGKTVKFFRKDIGPYFINDCCKIKDAVDAVKKEEKVEESKVEIKEVKKPTKKSKTKKNDKN